MNPFEMVIGIVLIGTVGSLIGKYIHARYGSGPDKAHDHGHGHGRADGDRADDTRGELKPYLEKIDALEERIRVLERIVTDRSERLSREIDELR
jgi:hypothetical protein